MSADAQNTRDDRIFSVTIDAAPEVLDQAAIDMRHHIEATARQQIESRLAEEGLTWPVSVRWRCEAIALAPDEPADELREEDMLTWEQYRDSSS